MAYLVLADAIALFHTVFVLFVVAGQVLIVAGWVRGWPWTRGRIFRVLHLAAIGFVVAQSWLGELCPLTVWENHFRALAGDRGLGDSFVAYWLHRALYWRAPPWVFVIVYTAFGAAVAVTFAAYPPRWRRRS